MGNCSLVFLAKNNKGDEMNILYTKDQLLKKFKGKYVDVYPRHYDIKDNEGNWITSYEVRGVSKHIKENFNLPEDAVI
jgi:hypothetical protein